MTIVYILFGLLMMVSYCKAGFNPWNKNEFKVHIAAGRIECFYQRASNGSIFHVAYQVIKGNDIIFYLNDAYGREQFRLNYDTKGSHQIPNVPEDGEYEFCLDNGYSQFYDKVVFVYMLTFHADSLRDKYNNEKEFNSTTEVIQKGTSNIHLRMIEVATEQALMRFRQARDDYLVEANNEMVLYWSLAQTIFIVFTSIFQVFFIKRLFSVKPHKSSRY